MHPSPRLLMRVFGRIGLLSFGGPAAQIALMHRELVETRGWLSEAQYLRALSFCMLLPGPEAMQLATYAGWRLRGIAGGIIAGGLFVLPGAALVMALALIYARFGSLPEVQAAFLGIKSVVVVIVLEALIRIARKALKGTLALTLALASFLALQLLNLPFPLIIGLTGLAGYLLAEPGTSAPVTEHGHATPARTLILWLALWLVPLAALWVIDPEFLGPLALFFSKLALVTFGGAYAVLSYMTQTVIGDFGWVSTAQMMDALGLAETTPGPLILVTEFVGVLAGYAEGGLALALVAGLVTLWMTFLPCFLFIFAGAPYIEALAARPRLQAALDAITAGVVGVIANLSLWFALHLYFADLIRGPGAVLLPDLRALQLAPLAYSLLAAVLLRGLHLPLPIVLIIAAAVALIPGLWPATLPLAGETGIVGLSRSESL